MCLSIPVWSQLLTFLNSWLRWDTSGEAEMDEALVQMSDIPKLSPILQQRALRAYSHEKEEVPQRPPPGHGNGNVGALWGRTGFWGVSLALNLPLHTKTNGSANPQSFTPKLLKLSSIAKRKDLLTVTILLANLGGFMILGGNQFEL